MKYDNEALADLCSHIDLLEYASQQMEFRKVGGRYFTNCPLHVDKTPSLAINPETNRFHCFSCGIQGSPIDFLCKYEHMKFPDAVDKISRLTGRELKQLKQCDALNYFKAVKKLKEVHEQNIQRELYDKDYYTEFVDETPMEWIEEGIPESEIKKFEIRIDKKSNRIVYPVYDRHLRLISVKGRTRFAKYKELRIQKYMNYSRIGTTDFFMGMKQNKNSILSHKEVIIFEGIKSVMKADSYGYDWSLASETSCLNDYQVEILISMGLKAVTIAYDSDVEMDKILKCTAKLRRFTNVYVVRNINNMLGEKMAPVDAGKEVWETLYKRRLKL